jgi:hypothetical protein
MSLKWNGVYWNRVRNSHSQRQAEENSEDQAGIQTGHHWNMTDTCYRLANLLRLRMLDCDSRSRKNKNLGSKQHRSVLPSVGRVLQPGYYTGASNNVVIRPAITERPNIP